MVKIELVSPDVAEKLCRDVAEDLPEYFGLLEVNEHYAVGVRSRINLAAKLESKYIGLISVDFPYSNNSDIYWLALFKECHSRNIGSDLIKAACVLAARDNYECNMVYMVKTISF
ncbi:MAG: hypothetical protein ACRYE9_01225 [Janthinobacterium lividum]